MRKFCLSLCCTVTVLIATVGGANATPAEKNGNFHQNSEFRPFTGRITSNKVRMRLHPNLEGMVLQELSKGDMLVVVGENEEFFAVKPDMGKRAYVFRTFVLDNVIEGSHVNVRLHPDLDAPVIAQLNTGDRVKGTVFGGNSKWLEIPAPDGVCFFVAKDFVENIGGPEFLAVMEQRKQDLENLLQTAHAVSSEELRKPFVDIDLALATQHYETLIDLYPDYPSEVERAKEALARVQETYLIKKIDYLEQRTDDNDSGWLANDSTSCRSKLDELEAELAAEMGEPTGTAQGKLPETARWVAAQKRSQPPFKTPKMAQWEALEREQLDGWLAAHNDKAAEDFYIEEQLNSTTLTGIVEPYDRAVHNKPGDFVLVDPRSHRTIAFLYSTKINLQDTVGKQVTISGTKRPNNNFAYPAYFALSAR